MQNIMLKIIFSIVVFFGILVQSNAAKQEKKIVYNFAQNWLRYDKYYEAYLPVKDGDLNKLKSVHQSIILANYKDFNLNFYATKGLSLFVNNKLIYKKISKEGELVKIPINSFRNKDYEEVLMTFYHSEGELPFYTTTIYVVASTATIKSDLAKNASIARILKLNVQNRFILFIFILFQIMLFKQVYPKAFLRFFSIGLQDKALHLVPSVFSISTIWIAGIVGFSFALLLQTVSIDGIIFHSETSFLGRTVLITSFYMLFNFGKYFYLSGIAWLFNYSKIATLQHFEFIRLLEIICLVATIILLGVEMSGFMQLTFSPITLYYSLIGVLVLCVLKVIILFFRLITYRNLYLFSYICAAEVLPLVIAVKILLF